MSDPSTSTTGPAGQEAPKDAVIEVEKAKRHAEKMARLAAAATPQGSGSGGPAWGYTRPIDHPLKECNFTRWLRYDSLPIERACFVLFGFEPPPLDALRFQQDNLNPTREPTYEVPPEYNDALESLQVSIRRGNVSALRITEHPSETHHVTWPELVRWARAKGFTIPMEIAAIVEKMDPSTEDVRTHQGDNKRALSGTSPPPETETAPVVATANDGVEPAQDALAANAEPTEAERLIQVSNLQSFAVDTHRPARELEPLDFEAPTELYRKPYPQAAPALEVTTPQVIPVTAVVAAMSDGLKPAEPNWKMRIQTEATELCLRLRKSGSSPTKRSILDSMAKWCKDNNVMTDGKIFPSTNYLRTHVLGGKHWDLPN